MYPTADGHMNIAAAWGHLWRELCKVIDRPDLPDDPRFAAPKDRSENRAQLNGIITEALAARTTDEWVTIMNDVGIPAGPVNDIGQTFNDPQVQHLGIASPVEHSTVGPIEVVRNATNIDGVSGAIRRPSPEAGQHSDEILAQFGVDPAEVAQLRNDGVVV